MKTTTKLLLGATVVAGLSISTFAACATDVDFGSTDGTNGKNITGLKDPTEAQHAATKAYVDNHSVWKVIQTGNCTADMIPFPANGYLRISVLGGFTGFTGFTYPTTGQVFGASQFGYPYARSEWTKDSNVSGATPVNGEIVANVTHFKCTPGVKYVLMRAAR